MIHYILRYCIRPPTLGFLVYLYFLSPCIIEIYSTIFQRLHAFRPVRSGNCSVPAKQPTPAEPTTPAGALRAAGPLQLAEPLEHTKSHKLAKSHECAKLPKHTEAPKPSMPAEQLENQKTLKNIYVLKLPKFQKSTFHTRNPKIP